MFDKAKDEDYRVAILTPAEIYGKEVLNLIDSDVQIKGIADIAGGGFSNVNRILPEGLSVEWKDNMLRPFIFDIFQKDGNISDEEITQVFNNGIGMCIIVDSKEVGKVFSQKISRPAFIAGSIV